MDRIIARWWGGSNERAQNWKVGASVEKMAILA